MSRGKDELNLDSKLAFGKYEGKSIREVLDEDSGYIDWASKNVRDFNLDDEVKLRLKKSNARTKAEFRRFFARLIEELAQSEPAGKVDWRGSADFYLIEVDQWVKFGVTSNWKNREFFYKEQFKDIDWKVVMKVEYPTRWQAEFLEQMVVHQLRPFVTPFAHEWVEHLGPQNVWDCVLQTVEKIEEVGWRKYEHIHRKGDNRWEFYKDIAMYEFDGKSDSDIHLYDDREPDNDVGF